MSARLLAWIRFPLGLLSEQQCLLGEQVDVAQYAPPPRLACGRDVRLIAAAQRIVVDEEDLEAGECAP